MCWGLMCWGWYDLLCVGMRVRPSLVHWFVRLQLWGGRANVCKAPQTGKIFCNCYTTRGPLHSLFSFTWCQAQWNISRWYLNVSDLLLMWFLDFQSSSGSRDNFFLKSPQIPNVRFFWRLRKENVCCHPLYLCCRSSQFHGFVFVVVIISVPPF